MTQTVIVNTSDLDIRRAREELACGLGLDAKRPTAWQQYGWPESVGFEQMLRAYERGGAGQGAVHRILDKCWEKLPRIKSPNSDKATPWETKVGKMMSAVSAWAKLRDFDRRNIVGRYAALIYRVADGRKLYEPLITGTKLVDLIPVYENQIRVETWDQDENSEDYGKPTMFSIETAPPTQRNEMARPRTWMKVHPSRVQLLAEGSVGDNFLDGVPLLLAGYNSLVDLEKIAGGSAESFLKNSARTVVFEYDPAAQPQAIGSNLDGTLKSVREIHEEQTRALNRNQDSSIVMQGGKANTLQTSVSDPKASFEVAANLFAASVRIPMTILFGAQTGRLASDEDRTDMNARCKARQENELTPMIAKFVSRMQAAGIIEPGEFEIEWPDLGAPSDKEKLGNAKEMAAINTEAFRAGMSGELPFDGEEIRKAAGYEQRPEGGVGGEGAAGDGGDDEGQGGATPPGRPRLVGAPKP